MDMRTYKYRDYRDVYMRNARMLRDMGADNQSLMTWLVRNARRCNRIAVAYQSGCNRRITAAMLAD